MKIVLSIALALAVPVPAMAQVEPVATPNDPGLSDLNYTQTDRMRLPVARGGDLSVNLADDETAQSISTAAPASWKVAIGAQPYTITIHAVAGATEAALSVLSNKRTYNFLLTPVAPTRAPYLVRMTYLEAARPAATVQTPLPVRGRYRVRGNPELRPSAMTDDGSKTYIEWRPDQAIPAVFALDRLKREEMVNGYMRDDVFTLDRVYDRLVFRIDRAEATASRDMKKVPR